MTSLSVRLALWLALSAIAAVAGTGTTYASAPLSEGVPARGFPPLETLDAVVERPLFSPARRKPVIQTVAVQSGGQIVLSGIVISKGKRYAMIRDETGGAGRRITEGQTIGGSTVRRILPDRVVLVAAGGAESVVRLFDAKSASAETLSRTAAQ